MDYAPYLPKVMFVLGALLQWARANTGFKDRYYAYATVGLCALAWWLTHPWAGPWRAYVLGWLNGLSDTMPALFGGTFIASSAAKAAVKSGASPDHAMVPLTNSKGGNP